MGAGPVTIDRVAHSDSSNRPPRKRWPVVLAVMGVLVVLLAVAGVFGGFRARPGGPVVAKPRSVVNQGLFNVQIMDARAGRMKLHEFDPVKNLLLVRMRVTNLGDQTYGVSTFVEGIAAEPRPGSYIAADSMGSEGDIDGEVTSSIHPRMPVTLQLVWPLGDATAPRTATLALREWEYGQSFTTDDFYWSVTKQSPITAKVAIPVRVGATS